MHTTHSLITLAGYRLHRIEFDPATFTHADLLWLPHHATLAHAAPKRQAEHLAGRLAAAHALQEHGISAVPAIGGSGEPLWPAGIAGSITHTSGCALAVVIKSARQPVGIDCETILPAEEAEEIHAGIVSPEEASRLRDNALPFTVALTLTFSAKESLFKALFPWVNAMMGFDSARVIALDAEHLTLALTRPLAGFQEGAAFTLHWKRMGDNVITLL